MNRISRNVTCFFIGVLIAFFFALPSFAGAVKVQPKKWYNNNTGGVTKGFTGSSSPSPWSSNDGVWSPPTYKSNGMFKKNGLEVPFSANQDFYSPDLYPALKEGVKGGLKGFAKGGFGLGPILGGLALTYAMEKGFEWKAELECQAQISCWQKRTASNPNSYNPLKDVLFEGYYNNKWNYLNIYPNTTCCTSLFSEIDAFCKQIVGTGQFNPTSLYCKHPQYPTSTTIYISVLRYQHIDSATPNAPAPSTVTAVPDAQVEAEILAAADANFPQWFQAAVDDDMIISIPDTRPVVPDVHPAVAAPAQVTTSTETRPDGSTVLQTQTAADAYTARCIVGADNICTATDPWAITEGQTVTQQTTTCTAAGTCETAVKTEEQTSPEPAPESDLCKSNPASVGCMDTGELPEDEDLPKQEQRLEFSWAPFALPNTCPAPEQIEIMGQVHEYDWSLTCDFAERMRPFVLLSAFLAAYFIVMGIKRNESN